MNAINSKAKNFSRQLSGIFCLLFLGTLAAGAAQVTLAWNASPDATVTGYSLYYGTVSGNYTQRIDVGNQMTATATNLTVGGQYYFAVTASTDLGLESEDSIEISYIVPPAAGTNQPPSISHFTVNAQGASLAWTSIPGRLYRVVYKNNLNDPQWIVASLDLSSTGGPMSWVDVSAAASSQRFYSVVLLP